MSFRVTALGAALMALTAAAARTAPAQTYPSQPLTLVVPFAAGGSPDVIARALGEELGAALGQTS